MKNTSHWQWALPVLGLLLPLVLFLLALFAQPARAASIVVHGSGDTVADDDTCILREAIDNANDTTDGNVHDDCAAGDPAGADTITFDADYTITLVRSQLPAVTTEVAITGNGAANTIIQASTCNPLGPDNCTKASWRVFEVSPGGNLTLDGITVRHGYCYLECNTLGREGGGILVHNSNAIEGTLVLTNSTLSNNYAHYGGGTYSTGTLLVIDSIVSGNSAVKSGGGIFSEASTTVTGSQVSGNWAVQFSGGGIYSTNTLVVNDSTVSENKAYDGAGILSLENSLTVTGSTLSGNWAWQEDGGGIKIIHGLATITDSTFSLNLAEYSGGGLSLHDGSVDVVDSTFSLNRARNQLGGGLSLSGGSVDVVDSTFSLNGAGHSGGGLSIEDGPVDVVGSTFSGNWAARYDGGAIHISSSSSDASVTNSTLSGNSAERNGGGINSYSPLTQVTNSTISGNTARSGAGIHIGDGQLTMTNSLLTAKGVDNCAGDLNADASNIADDDSCDSATQKTTGEIALGPLQDNGGPTFTHALLPGSQAIDFDTSASCAAAPVNGLDQRGEPRNVDGDGQAGANECDTGAYEAAPAATATPTPTATATASATSSPTATASATPSPSATPTDGPSPTPTATATEGPSPTPMATTEPAEESVLYLPFVIR